MSVYTVSTTILVSSLSAMIRTPLPLPAAAALTPQKEMWAFLSSGSNSSTTQGPPQRFQNQKCKCAASLFIIYLFVLIVVLHSVRNVNVYTLYLLHYLLHSLFCIQSNENVTVQVFCVVFSTIFSRAV